MVDNLAKEESPWVPCFEEMTSYLVEDLMFGYVYDGTDPMILDPGSTPLIRMERGAIFTVISSLKSVNLRRNFDVRHYRSYFTAYYTLVLHNEQLLLVSNNGGPCIALPSKP